MYNKQVQQQPIKSVATSDEKSVYQQEQYSQMFELTAFRDTSISIPQGCNMEEIQARQDEHCLHAQIIDATPQKITTTQISPSRTKTSTKS